MVSILLWCSMIFPLPEMSFQELIFLIQQRKIEPSTAQINFQRIIDSLRRENGNIRYVQEPKPIFPLKGYTLATSYKPTMSKYTDTLYNFFEKALNIHPAIDLFIKDKNKDGIDDITKKQVAVVSITEGVVIAVNKNKELGDIWVYDFYNHALIYYAFCQKINVHVGDRLGSGTQIASVGIRGKQQCKKGAGTRLHVMILSLGEDNLPQPMNPLEILNKTQ